MLKNCFSIYIMEHYPDYGTHINALYRWEWLFWINSRLVVLLFHHCKSRYSIETDDFLFIFFFFFVLSCKIRLVVLHIDANFMWSTTNTFQSQCCDKDNCLWRKARSKKNCTLHIFITFFNKILSLKSRLHFANLQLMIGGQQRKQNVKTKSRYNNIYIYISQI